MDFFAALVLRAGGSLFGDPGKSLASELEAPFDDCERTLSVGAAGAVILDILVDGGSGAAAAASAAAAAALYTASSSASLATVALKLLRVACTNLADCAVHDVTKEGRVSGVGGRRTNYMSPARAKPQASTKRNEP